MAAMRSEDCSSKLFGFCDAGFESLDGGVLGLSDIVDLQVIVVEGEAEEPLICDTC